MIYKGKNLEILALSQCKNIQNFYNNLWNVRCLLSVLLFSVSAFSIYIVTREKSFTVKILYFAKVTQHKVWDYKCSMSKK